LPETPPAPRDGARRSRSARQTRDRLARAAVELFTTRGYHETTTPLLAERAGVAEGTIYRHFPSKDDLLNEVFRAAARAFLEPLKAADPATPCHVQLAAVSERWCALAAKEPALVRLVFGSGFAALVDDRSRAALRELRAQVERIVAAGKAAREVRLGAADLWAETWLRLIVLGLDRIAAGQWQLGDPGIQQLHEAAWDAIRAAPVPLPADGAATHDPAPGAPR